MQTDAINAFLAKLNIWIQRAKNDNFTSFHRLSEITVDHFEQTLKGDIIDHLQNFQGEFVRYFPKIDTSSILETNKKSFSM